MLSDLERCVTYINKVIKKGGTLEYALEELQRSKFSEELLAEAKEVHLAQLEDAAEDAISQSNAYKKLTIPKKHSHEEHKRGVRPIVWKRMYITSPLLGLFLTVPPMTRIIGLLLISLWLMLSINNLVLFFGTAFFRHGKGQSFWGTLQTSSLTLIIVLFVAGVFTILDSGSLFFAGLLLLALLTLMFSLFYNMSKSSALLISLILLVANVFALVAVSTAGEYLGVIGGASTKTPLDMQHQSTQSFSGEEFSTPGLDHVERSTYSDAHGTLKHTIYYFTTDTAAKAQSDASTGYTLQGNIAVNKENCMAYWIDGVELHMLKYIGDNCSVDLGKAAQSFI